MRGFAITGSFKPFRLCRVCVDVALDGEGVTTIVPTQIRACERCGRRVPDSPPVLLGQGDYERAITERQINGHLVDLLA